MLSFIFHDVSTMSYYQIKSIHIHVDQNNHVQPWQKFQLCNTMMSDNKLSED